MKLMELTNKTVFGLSSLFFFFLKFLCVSFLSFSFLFLFFVSVLIMLVIGVTTLILLFSITIGEVCINQ